MGSGNTIVVFFSCPISTKSLQVAQLDCRRLSLNNFRGHAKLLRGHVLALSMNDLGAPLTLRFGLPADGPDHLFRYVNLLDGNQSNLHPPRRRVLVENGLQPHVQFVAFAQEIVEFDFAQNAAQEWSAPAVRWRIEKLETSVTASRGSTTRK